MTFVNDGLITSLEVANYDVITLISLDEGDENEERPGCTCKSLMGS